MSQVSHPLATVEDLERYDGRAELIAGRIVPLSPHGYCHGLVAGEIYASLREHSRRTEQGKAFPDGIGYLVTDLASGRQSFSPDASYYDGPPPRSKADFIPNPPTFAVEVRSKSERGPAGEADRAAKRADYFEAGTLVVWDVDPFGETIQVHRHTAPDRPQTYRKGDVAEAEPAVPGWTIPVAEIFAE